MRSFESRNKIARKSVAWLELRKDQFAQVWVITYRKFEWSTMVQWTTSLFLCSAIWWNGRRNGPAPGEQSGIGRRLCVEIKQMSPVDMEVNRWRRWSSMQGSGHTKLAAHASGRHVDHDRLVWGSDLDNLQFSWFNSLMSISIYNHMNVPCTGFASYFHKYRAIHK